MPRPEGWKGSNMSSRTAVVAWLKRHGGRYEQSDGKMVGQMKADLGMGRALSQLLADMEHDGMIKRELGGRRTFSIELVDDWGLATGIESGRWTDSADADQVHQRLQSAPFAQTVPGTSQTEVAPTGDVDYDELAAVLLARVIRQAHAVPSQGAELTRLSEKVDQLTAERDQAREALALSMAEAAEQRQQAETMRKNLADFQSAVDKPKKRGGVPLRDALAPKDRQLLDRLMREVPAR